jgi:molybdopterin converting factor small subunit
VIAIVLLEALIVIGIWTLFVTQIVVPGWRGTQFFPWFRRDAGRRERELLEQQEEVKQKLVEAKLKAEIEKVRQQLKEQVGDEDLARSVRAYRMAEHKQETGEDKE